MATDPLAIGDTEKGNDGDELLDKVNIAWHGKIEERPSDDLNYAHQHQKEDSEGRDQVQAVLEARENYVKAGQPLGGTLP